MLFYVPSAQILTLTVSVYKVIGIVQTIMMRNKRIVMKREVFSKQQQINTAHIAETIILLNLMQIVF